MVSYSQEGEKINLEVLDYLKRNFNVNVFNKSLKAGVINILLMPRILSFRAHSLTLWGASMVGQ